MRIETSDMRSCHGEAAKLASVDVWFLLHSPCQILGQALNAVAVFWFWPCHPKNGGGPSPTHTCDTSKMASAMPNHYPQGRFDRGQVYAILHMEDYLYTPIQVKPKVLHAILPSKTQSSTTFRVPVAWVYLTPMSK